ncbi:MAG: hypothetical protein M3O82_10290 [Verrucomicrobiota bacterium]|nr:hypothetical protein [Verrucomicrobiota bacterium]
MGALEGSLWRPLVFHDVMLTWRTALNTSLRIEVEKSEVHPAWKEVLLRRDTSWLRKVFAEGVRVSSSVRNPVAPTELPAPRGARWNRLVPDKLSVSRANIVLHEIDGSIRLRNVRFVASIVEPGEISAEMIVVERPWFRKEFRSARGVTSRQGVNFAIAGFKLQNGITLDNFTLDMAKLAGGDLSTTFAFSAFDGSIRGEIKNKPNEGPLVLQANGWFERISIDSLARFLETDQPAGGTIREGKFTFNGSPRDLNSATLSTRLEANDFQWGGRRWNSLTLGATLSNHRVQIPELRLKQQSNELQLSGEMALPGAGIEWWRSDFSFDVVARIANLTELSALLGPKFENTAGRVSIDGSVRARNQSFTGQLAVAGSELSYGAAPLDRLRAEVKLNANEIQVANLEFVHGGDTLKGQGVVNIFGEKRYWGELTASVSNLALYSYFFSMVGAPSWTGGLNLDWSGDGTAKAHSGAFQAKLKKFRGIGDAHALPLDADLEATYSPGNVFFSKFVVADADSYFSALVTVAPWVLNLQSIRLQRGDALLLEGDAELPISAWKIWPEGSLTDAIDWSGAVEVKLRARDFRIQDALRLTGHERRVKGEIDGPFLISGLLLSPKIEGILKIRRAELLSVSSLDADLSMHGQICSIEKSSAHFGDVTIAANGDVDFADARNPTLDLKVRAENVTLEPAPGIVLTASALLETTGKWNGATAKGTATITSVRMRRAPTMRDLFSRSGTAFSLSLGWDQMPFADWTLGIQTTSKVALESGSAQMDIALIGTGRAPRVAGKIDVADIHTVAAAGDEFQIDEGTLFFSPAIGTPSLALRGSGHIGGESFTGYVNGAWNDRTVTVFSDSEEPSEKLLRALVEPFSDIEVGAAKPLEVGPIP